jgi:hypothetical protein
VHALRSCNQSIAQGVGFCEGSGDALLQLVDLVSGGQGEALCSEEERRAGS